MKDHLKSKKHSARKQAKQSKSSSTSVGASTSRQATLGTVLTSNELRGEFVLDYLKMCTLADKKARRSQIKSFQAVFSKSLQKLETHIDNLPAYPYYKAVRVFDPRQLAVLSHNIGDYSAIPSLQDPTHTLAGGMANLCPV